MAQTLKCKGAGGAIFDLDVPPVTDVHLRERFVQRIASGDLIVLDDDGDPIDRIGVLDELAGGHGEAADADLHSLSVKELRALAATRGVELGDAKSKATIVAALELAADDDHDDD